MHQFTLIYQCISIIKLIPGCITSCQAFSTVSLKFSSVALTAASTAANQCWYKWAGMSLLFLSWDTANLIIPTPGEPWAALSMTCKVDFKMAFCITLFVFLNFSRTSALPINSSWNRLMNSGLPRQRRILSLTSLMLFADTPAKFQFSYCPAL